MRLLTCLVFVVNLLIVGTAFSQSTIEPGNQLKLQLGDVSEVNKTYRVSPKGTITIPELGKIKVSGITADKIEGVLKKELKKYYKDSESLVVTVASHEIFIKVFGYVNSPGIYLIPEEGNLQIAISKAKGLKPGAQMDKLKLVANGKVKIINYKKYLDSGEHGILPKLKAMNEIFVPSSKLLGNVKSVDQLISLNSKGDGSELTTSIKVFGEVHKPGAYQFSKNMSALDYVLKAGGVTRYAGVDQIRVIDKNIPLPFNLKEYLNTGSKKYMPAVTPGATIFVPQRTDEVKSGSRTVYVMGQIHKPGAYEISKKATFIEVLANAGGPNRYADTRKIRILQPGGRVTEFDLQAYTEGLSKRSMPKVGPGEAIFLPMKTDLNEKSWLDIAPKAAVRIIGAVVRPGRYEWSNEMNLLDLLSHAGGPDKKADIAHVKIIPNHGSNRRVRSISFNLSKFIEKGGRLSDIPTIKSGYTVVIPELPQSPHDNKSIWTRQASANSIYVFGQVNKPGRYNFNKDLNFLDILSASDGPTEAGDIHDIHVIDRQGSYPRVEHVNLSLYFDTGDPQLLPRVLPGDAIFIPEKSKAYTDINSNHVIKVLGEVAKPGRYKYTSNLTILDLLATAGGPTSQAYVEKILVVSMQNGVRSHSRTFDLLKFSKTGDNMLLPTLKEGDVVYIPHNNEDAKKQFSDLLRDLANLAAIVRLAT